MYHGPELESASSGKGKVKITGNTGLIAMWNYKEKFLKAVSLAGKQKTAWWTWAEEYSNWLERNVLPGFANAWTHYVDESGRPWAWKESGVAFFVGQGLYLYRLPDGTWESASQEPGVRELASGS